MQSLAGSLAFAWRVFSFLELLDNNMTSHAALLRSKVRNLQDLPKVQLREVLKDPVSQNFQDIWMKISEYLSRRTKMETCIFETFRSTWPPQRRLAYIRVLDTAIWYMYNVLQLYIITYDCICTKIYSVSTWIQRKKYRIVFHDATIIHKHLCRMLWTSCSWVTQIESLLSWAELLFALFKQSVSSRKFLQ